MDEFLCYKERKNRRPDYLRTMKTFLRMVARDFPQSVHEIPAEEIELWLYRKWHKPSTVCGRIGRLSSFFSFCVRRRYCEHNPIRFLERPTIERNPPTILTPRQADDFLKTVSNHDLLGYTALGLFTGIRPSELARMNWDAINIEPRDIRDLKGYGLANVSAAASKVRYRRIVPIHPACLPWLRKCERNGPIVKRSRTHPFTAPMAATAGFTWSPDILRHTAASYMMALYEDAGRVSHWLGNSQSILLNHYYQLVTHEDCLAFWSIVP